MEQRERTYFENDAFLAAIFMDRRINYIGTPFLNEEQQNQGMQHLQKLWEAMSLESAKPCTSSTTTAKDSSFQITQSVQKVSRLEQFLLENIASAATSDVSTMAVKLKKFVVQDRLPIETDVLRWWEQNKCNDLDLYNLACIALAVPCTQVSVERAFSGFAQVFTSFRTRLGKSRMEMILFIKLNSDLFRTYDVEIAPDSTLSQ
ncbi:uncharacterized protein LOC131692317 [Topomyia yanbarensis]|uniref:uncharacterized protein LOC131692317 n=1 Tax=Topomyia yanbarensis TaxID=2498891 RepID=UPI00273C9472|nr:uncharacterized protein LOC131692317 [Topomyia yanbarensis]